MILPVTGHGIYPNWSIMWSQIVPQSQIEASHKSCRHTVPFLVVPLQCQCTCTACYWVDPRPFVFVYFATTSLAKTLCCQRKNKRNHCIEKYSLHGSYNNEIKNRTLAKCKTQVRYQWNYHSLELGHNDMIWNRMILNYSLFPKASAMEKYIERPFLDLLCLSRACILVSNISLLSHRLLPHRQIHIWRANRTTPNTQRTQLFSLYGYVEVNRGNKLKRILIRHGRACFAFNNIITNVHYFLLECFFKPFSCLNMSYTCIDVLYHFSEQPVAPSG